MDTATPLLTVDDRRRQPVRQLRAPGVGQGVHLAVGLAVLSHHLCRDRPRPAQPIQRPIDLRSVGVPEVRYRTCERTCQVVTTCGTDRQQPKDCVL